MMPKDQIAYAAVRKNGANTDWIFPPSVRNTAKGVREFVGWSYCKDDWRKGWDEALKDGYRVRRIVMRVSP